MEVFYSPELRFPLCGQNVYFNRTVLLKEYAKKEQSVTRCLHSGGVTNSNIYEGMTLHVGYNWISHREVKERMDRSNAEQSTFADDPCPGRPSAETWVEVRKMQIGHSMRDNWKSRMMSQLPELTCCIKRSEQEWRFIFTWSWCMLISAANVTIIWLLSRKRAYVEMVID